VPLNRFLPFSAASLLLLAMGCTHTQQTGPSFSVYVVENGTTGSSLLQLPANNGSVTPANTITVPMQTTYQALAVDTAGNLYVSASNSATTPAVNEILVYAPTATGAATATSTITSSSLTAAATSIAVDATGTVYALSGNSILVFAAGSGVNTTPVRLITGAATLLNSASAIAVDSVQNIYVANTAGGNVLVFSSIQTGNVAPSSILAGSSTQISMPIGVAVDLAGDIYVASYNKPSTSSVIMEFAPGATGNVAPTKSLTSVASDAVAGLAVDVLNNLYVVTDTATSNILAVDVFSPSASGSNGPASTITSSAWTTSTYGQVAVR
jgi:hypothetical protein